MRILIPGMLLALLLPATSQGGYTRPVQQAIRLPVRTQPQPLRVVRMPNPTWKSTLGSLPTYAVRPATLAQRVVRTSAVAPAQASAGGIEGLLARRALNPARFDYYHPQVGPVLQDIDTIRSASGVDCTPYNGLLPNTPYFNHLRWRRSLNPARFDYYHPMLGLILKEDQRIRDLPECHPQPGEIIPPTDGGTPGGGTNPPPGGGGIPGGGGGTNPPGPVPNPVPEPSSYLLMAIGAGVLGLRYRNTLLGRRRLTS